MCAKHTRSTPQKVVKVGKTPKGKSKSNAESDDENQSPNRSLRSSGHRREQSSSLSSFSTSDSRQLTPDTSPDFIGRRPTPDTSPDCLAPPDVIQRYIQSNPSRQAPSNTDRPSNQSHSQANTSQGRISRKQPKPRRRKDHALNEIRKYQMSSDLLIQKLPFQRVVREIMQKYGEYRIQSLALQALQESAEFFLVQMFEDSVLCCIHRKRVTVNDKDMRLVRNLRGASDPSYDIM